MAIVQISRIQNRRGVSENLPQLAVGEIGLSVDTRRVYIGNGGTDAPKIENIELLTASSDLLDSADTYTYKGALAGYTATTGVTANDPITRTMQQKFDDMASVKDFGAKGDGVTDDTTAINRALYELFSRASNSEIRRSLFFPAGTYIVSNIIKIPTYAKLYGEGHSSSIIKATTAGGDAVAMTSDSLQQIDGSIGAGGAALPGNVDIDGITFWSNAGGMDGFVVNQAQTVTFSNCGFQGNATTVPTSTGRTAVKIESSTTRKTSHVHFVGCNFSLASNHVVADHDMNSITFSGCSFEFGFKALKIGESITGSSPSIIGPRGIKVTNSVFDKIYNRAIHIYNGPGFTSAFNTFLDCGNHALGVGNPNTHVIDFAADEAHSVADTFERTDGDDTSSTRRVSVDTNHKAGLAFDTEGVKFGGYIRDYGRSVTLDNNSTKSTGITFADNTDYTAIEIDYYISRSTTPRQGTLRITHNATAQVIDDEFSENNGDAGVTFSLTNGANISTLNYTTTNTGNSATFNYSIRIIR